MTSGFCQTWPCQPRASASFSSRSTSSSEAGTRPVLSAANQSSRCQPEATVRNALRVNSASG